VRTGRPASELIQTFATVPQLLRNVRFAAGREPLAAASVRSVIAQAEIRLRGNGRLLIRKSGTEPLIRVMAESEDEILLRDVVGGIVDAVEAAA